MSEFVGREKEIDLLARRIAAGESRPLLITGPRRIGRTSLLREFRRRRGPRADQGGILLARIACRTAALSPLHLATAVGGELAMQCAAADGIAVDRERLFDPHQFTEVLEEFPVQPLADFARAIASFSKGTRRGADVLLRAVANLGRVIGDVRNCWITLMLDDVGALTQPAVGGFLEALAQSTQAGGRVQVVATAVSGREAAALASPNGPFAGAVDVHELGPLDEESGDALVLRVGSRAGLYAEQAVLERVQKLTAGRPFYIRAVMERALAHFDRDARFHPREIDTAFVRECFETDGRIAAHCAELADEACEAVGGDTTARLTLAALAESDYPSPATAHGKLRDGTRPIRPAAEALLVTDLFESVEGQVRFADPVVRFWCARALTRDRVADLDRPESIERLAAEFSGRFAVAAEAVPAPNFRGLAALCAGRNLPAEHFGAEPGGSISFPTFKRIQGYAFAERDMKLYQLEPAERPTQAASANGGAKPWAALFIWRDLPLGRRQLDIIRKWLEARTERIWIVSRHGLEPDALAAARDAGVLVSSQAELSALSQHLGAATLSAGRTGKTARMEKP
ncbi:MAG: ATP-binding protein [Planctomycetota bacterium]